MLSILFILNRLCMNGAVFIPEIRCETLREYFLRNLPQKRLYRRELRGLKFFLTPMACIL